MAANPTDWLIRITKFSCLSCVLDRPTKTFLLRVMRCSLPSVMEAFSECTHHLSRECKTAHTHTHTHTNILVTVAFTQMGDIEWKKNTSALSTVLTKICAWFTMILYFLDGLTAVNWRFEQKRPQPHTRHVCLHFVSSQNNRSKFDQNQKFLPGKGKRTWIRYNQ